MIQDEVQRLEKEGRRAKTIEFGTQGAWTRWNLPKRTITWHEMWRLEPFRISFMLRAVYDTLPTPVNLHRWRMKEDSLCKLCGDKGTMAHILSGCKTALTQGRYRWCHGKVLAQLADILEQERRKKRPAKTKPSLSTITFIREGQRPGVQGQARQNLLQSAQGWELEVDLGRKLHFPEAVLSTTL